MPHNSISRWGKPTYKTDRRLPRGWSFFATSKAIYYRVSIVLKWFTNHRGGGSEIMPFLQDAEGKFLKNRRNVLAEMISRGGYSRTEVRF